MTERWAAFDVETPNYANSRMSAIGVAVVEGEEITEEFFTLVNPEQRFDRFNIALTGITPAMVQDAPTFPELWPRLAEYFQGAVLVAHNAPFDLSVLGKCLGAYGLSWEREVPYLCTCRMGRKLLPQLPNHKLNTLCDHLGLELRHHQADSDTRACAQLLLHYLQMGARPEDFLRRYNLLTLRTAAKGPAAPGGSW